jgi:lysophospholipase L1-like esterase
MNIFIFGDSITWGAWDSQGGWAQRLKTYFDERSMNRSKDEVYTYILGVSGDTSGDLLNRFDVEFGARLDQDDTDRIIIFAIGINDSSFLIKEQKHIVEVKDYGLNINKLIKKAKRYTKNIVCIGLTSVDDIQTNPIPWETNIAYLNKYVYQYDEQLEKVCLKNGVTYIKVFDDFSNQSSFLSDGLHPNTKGHELLYKTIRDALKLQ